jgi:transcriptional regulator with XRE-family HTH domain
MEVFMDLKIGTNIKRLRTAKNLTQEQLSTAMNVSCAAVSKWERSETYPDITMLLPLANYFGVSMDELFGYEGEQRRKVDMYFDQIIDMNHRNNGVDSCMDECIAFARECLAEFPDNPKLLYGMATVLFNVGYVRYGEHHLVDAEGYDVYDTERHSAYREWQEAIKIYEKLLTVLEAGELRNRTVRELLQLYVNTGDKEKALSVIETLPDMLSCREPMLLNSCDGKERARVCAENILKTVDQCARLMISSIMINQTHYSPDTAAEITRNAIKMYELVITDGNFGIYHAALVCMNLYLSEHLWRAGDRDGAFEALDAALAHARKNEAQLANKGQYYTSPLVRLAKIESKEFTEAGKVAWLAEDWPWWSSPDCTQAKAEIQADSRWADWVRRTRE